MVGIIRRPNQPFQPMIEGFRTEGDRGQGVVDLMRNPGSQKTDSRQPLRPHELPAPFVNLPLEVGVGHADLGRHVVESFGKILHLVAGLEVDLVVERAASHGRTPRCR